MVDPGLIRVLIVDDQQLARFGHSLVLRSADDMEVAGEAADGPSAVTLALELRPDVVLMDVRMPGMSGIEATAAISRGSPGTSVIVMTSFDLDRYAFGALDAGASAFLLKSTGPDELLAAVRTVAGGDAVVAPRITKKLIEHYTAGDLGRSARAPRPSELESLSPREYDVLLSIAEGMTNAEIAAHHHLSPATVKSHVNRLFSKLGMRDRVQAVILAHRLGLTRDS